MLSEYLSEALSLYIEEYYEPVEGFRRIIMLEEPRLAAFERAVADSLPERLDTLDLSFRESLLLLIREKDLDETEVYKRAQLDRRLFSKIRSNKDYRPAKTTVLALCIGMELTLDETEQLLRKAGFALSHSRKDDVIVEFFIRQSHYDLDAVNEALFRYDQRLLS